MKLTDTACKNAKAKDKAYKRFDGGGLYLEVMPNGNKLWRLKYRYLGKEKRFSLGAYPLVTLAEAREGRDEAKKLLAKDIDPVTAKQDRKKYVIRDAANTFEAIAREWHENQKERWSRAYPGKVMRCFEKNVFPHIGNRPIAQITPPEILECLRKIEKRGSLDVAATTKQLCGQVFRYGIQTGKCERDATADLRGALKIRKTKHYAAIEAKDRQTDVEYTHAMVRLIALSLAVESDIREQIIGVLLSAIMDRDDTLNKFLQNIANIRAAWIETIETLGIAPDSMKKFGPPQHIGVLLINDLLPEPDSEAILGIKNSMRQVIDVS